MPGSIPEQLLLSSDDGSIQLTTQRLICRAKTGEESMGLKDYVSHRYTSESTGRYRFFGILLPKAHYLTITGRLNTITIRIEPGRRASFELFMEELVNQANLLKNQQDDLTPTA